MADRPIVGTSGGSEGVGRIVLCSTCAGLLVWLFLGWSRSAWIIGMDEAFFRFFGTVTRESWALDILVVQMFRTNTAKIVPLLACVVWLLFERRRHGESIAFFGQLLLGSLLAMTLSRLMQNLSAYRPRPLHAPDLAYDLPFGIDSFALEGWSSFPSDTSALAFAIATGLYLASRRLGIAALLWTVMVVAFPRAYAGLHYPSDLLGGALIGVLCTAGIAPLILGMASRRSRELDQKWQPFLWAFGFLFLFQMGAMFDDVRTYGTFVRQVLGASTTE